MHIQDITNFLEIKPWLGTAGMPTSDQLEIITAAGYQSVINLALNQSPGAIPEEEQVVRQVGMKYFHIPAIWEQPKVSEYLSFSALMLELAGEKVFVHCVLNMRVSVFVYLYRVLQLEESSQEAYKDILKIWKPDHTWNAFIKEVLSHHE